MKRFFVISNTDKDVDLKKAGEIRNYLESKGAMCEVAGITRDMDAKQLCDKLPVNTECALVLGGDGTFIQAADPLAGTGISILGVNLGKLGYLAEIDKDSIIPTLDRLLADEYSIESRMMLEGYACLDGEMYDKHLALNDIAIARVGAIRVVTYAVYVNGKLLFSFDADGVIVSTPTGSTGYSMSAGGPIVEPDAEVILVTPVAAHTLNSRSIVLSPCDRLKIEVVSKNYGGGQESLVSFDGGKGLLMKSGDYVEISRANEITHVIKISKESFLDTLARKISS